MNSNNQSTAKDPNSLDLTETNDLKESSQDSNQIPSATTNEVPEFGWSGYAERINGRFAMIGFMSILIVEALTHDAFLHWAGFIP